jgi:ribonuclease HI
MRVTAHIDGGSRGNPGPAAAGFVLRDADDGQVLQQAGVFLGEATNNVAEYRGLIEALQRAQLLGVDELDVRSDSELLVRQMNGQYRVKNAGLKPLFEQANELAGRFGRFAISHVRREQNTDADELVNRALNLKRSVEE